MSSSVPPLPNLSQGRVTNSTTNIVSGTRLILSVYARFHERLAGIISTNLKEAPPETFERSKLKPDLLKAPLTRAVKKDETGLKRWLWFPRETPIYQTGIYTLVQTVHQVAMNEPPTDRHGSSANDESSGASTATPLTGFNFLVKLLVEWIPQRKLSVDSTLLRYQQDAAPTEIENKFSFTAFASRIPNLKLSDQKQLDVVEAVVLLVVADIMYLALKLYNPVKTFDSKTIERLYQMCMALSRPSKPRALDPNIWNILCTPICMQWSNVLGQLTPHILPMVTNFISQDLGKLPPDAQVAALSALRLRFDGAYWYSKESDTMSLLTAFLIQFMTKDKAVGFRTAQLEILDAWLMTLDMSSGGPCFDLIKQQIKLIEKAQKNEDTEAAATCLLSTILAHGASSFLEKNIDVHLSKLLLKNVWNPKKKDFCLESILRILRGQYTGSQVNFDNVGVLDWLPSPPEGVSLAESAQSSLPPYAYAGLAFDESKMVQRLITITSALFGQKSLLPKIEQSVDICVEIVLQMCAHSIKFGLNTVLPQLLHGPTQHRLIGIRALRRLLDPQSGFLEHSYCLKKQSDEEGSSEGQSGKFNVETVKTMLTETVASILTTCYQHLIRDTRDVSKYEAIALQFPTACNLVQSLLSSFKTQQIASEQLRGCLDRIKLVATTEPIAAARINSKEIDQTDMFVEERAKRWCMASEVPFPGNKIFIGLHRLDDGESSTGTLGGSGFSISATSGSGGSLTSAPGGLPAGASSSAQTDAKKWKKKLFTSEKLALHELAKEAIQCVEFLKPTEQLLKSDEFILGPLLLHYDNEIATATSHALQTLILKYPDLRVHIVRQVLHLVIYYMSCSAPMYAPQPGIEENNVYALLNELLILLDLWSLVTFQEQLPPPTRPTASPRSPRPIEPPPRPKLTWSTAAISTLLDEIEGVALVTLCDSVNIVRTTALSLMGAVEALREHFSLLEHNRGTHGSAIMQKARYEYILEAAQGIEDQVAVATDKILVKIEQCAASRQELLWSFVLSNIGYTLIDYQESLGVGSTVVLRIARNILLHRVETWRTIAQTNGASSATSPPVMAVTTTITASSLLAGQITASSSGGSAASLFAAAQVIAGDDYMRVHGSLPHLYRNIHTLLFSLAAAVPSVALSVADTFNQSTAAASVKIDETAKADEFNIQISLAPYLTYFFKNLQLTDDQPLLQSLIFSASRIHWRSMGYMLGVLWYRYYLALSSKRVSKKRTKARPDIAQLLRRITQRPQFKDALRLDTQGALDSIAATAQIPLPGNSTSGQLLVSRVCIHFIEETATVFNTHYSKVPSLHISDYFIANMVVVTNFLKAVEALNRLGAADAIICPHSGPLRHFLSPTNNRSALVAIMHQIISPDHGKETAESESAVSTVSVVSTQSSSTASTSTTASSAAQNSSNLPLLRAILGTSSGVAPLLPAAPDWKELCELLLSWSGISKFSQLRKNIDQTEATRTLARIKDSARRDARKAQFDSTLSLVNSIAMESLEQLARLGLLLTADVGVTDMKKILNDWVLQAERTFGCNLLRWLLASKYSTLWEIYLDRCFVKSSKESSFFAMAIYDQFLDSSATAVGSIPPQIGVTEATTQFFTYMTGVHKERLKLERSALRREDKDFAKVVVTNGGALLFVVLVNLNHSSYTVRKRSFEMLYRLAPISWGYGNVPADTIAAKRLYQLRDAFLDRLAEGVAPNEEAIEASALTAELCSIFTEDVFREAFKRFPSLSSSQKYWTVQVLTFWMDNVLLSTIHTSDEEDADNNERISSAQPLRHLKPRAFLEQVFYQFTVELAEKTYTQSPLKQLWLRLAAISAVNLRLIVDYLIEKVAAPITGDDTPRAIAKALLLELYRDQPAAIAKHMTSYLTITAITAAAATAASSKSDGAKDSQDSTEKFTEADARREAVVSVLSDFAVDSIEPLLPHLHIIFHYCTIKIDNSEASACLSTLLRCVISSLRNLIISKDAKRARYLTKTNGVLEGILDLLQHHALKLDWCFDRSTTIEMSSTTLTPGSYYSTLRPSAGQSRAEIRGQQRSSVRVTLRRTGAAQLVDWATIGFLPSLLVGILCQAAFWADVETQRDIRSKWADECLQWIRQHSAEMTVPSTKSIEILSALLAEDDDEEAARDGEAPNALLPDYTLIHRLRTALFESVVNLDRALRSTAVSPHNIGQMTLRRLQQQQETINLYRARTGELLDMFIKISAQIKEETAILELFWIAVSVLRLSPMSFSTFFERALQIIQHLVVDNADSFLKLHPSSVIFQKLLKRAATWGFNGLLPMLVKSLYSPRTERIGVPLILHVLALETSTSTRTELFPLLGLRQDGNSAPLLLLAFVPWLYTTISIAYAAPQVVPARDREIALKLISTVSSSFLQIFDTLTPDLQEILATEVIPLFKQLAAATDPNNITVGSVPHPETVICTIVQALASCPTPSHTEFLAVLDSVLLEGPLKFVDPVMKAVSQFITTIPQSMLASLANDEHLINIITEATYRATIASSSAELAALELINRLSMYASPVKLHGASGTALEPFMRSGSIISAATEQRTLRPIIEAVQPEDHKSRRSLKRRPKTRGTSLVEKPDLKRVRTKRSNARLGSKAGSSSGQPSDTASAGSSSSNDSGPSSRRNATMREPTRGPGVTEHRRMRSHSNTQPPLIDLKERVKTEQSAQSNQSSNASSSPQQSNSASPQTTMKPSMSADRVHVVDLTNLDAVLTDDDINDLLAMVQSMQQIENARSFIKAELEEDDESSSSEDEEEDEEESSGSDEEEEAPSGIDMAYLAEFDLEGVNLAPFQPPATPREPTSTDDAQRKGSDADKSDDESKSNSEGNNDDLDLLFDNDSIEKALQGLRGYTMTLSPEDEKPAKKKKPSERDRSRSRARSQRQSVNYSKRYGSSSTSEHSRRHRKRHEDDSSDEDSDNDDESEEEETEERAPSRGRERAQTITDTYGTTKERGTDRSSKNSGRYGRESVSSSTKSTASSASSKPPRLRDRQSTSVALKRDDSSSSSSDLDTRPAGPPTAVARATSQKLRHLQHQLATGAAIQGDASHVEVERIMSNPKLRSQLLEFVTKNNYNKELVLFLEAVHEFKTERDLARASSKAKRIMDRYFPKKASLTLLADIPDPLRQEVMAAYDAITPGTPPPNFFSKPELYVINHIAKNYLPMFLKSDYSKSTE